MAFSFRRWLRISLFNLMLIAAIGVILRYKIAFALPIIDQKHLLHAHSHFAFSGWISQVLMVLMIQYLARFTGDGIFKKYRLLLNINLFTAYGMLVCFFWQGYGLFSISFSTLSIINAYWFAIRYWKDLGALPKKTISQHWFRAALLFYSISSVGAFSLAYMMANHIFRETWYLGAVYFFLHFQYNGWFFFAIMGLLSSRLELLMPETRIPRIVFWLFALACIPAYFLSALWMPIPWYIYLLVLLSALAQCAGWGLYIKHLLRYRNQIKEIFSLKAKPILLLAAAALTIKLLLQLGSTHPALSQLAFGFRPIVIGYLHLVLLGVISLFILGFIVSMNVGVRSPYFMKGLWIFVAGIMLNELLLMLQGITGLSYIMIPLINELLLGAAIVMLLGAAIFNAFFFKKELPNE